MGLLEGALKASCSTQCTRTSFHKIIAFVLGPGFFHTFHENKEAFALIELWRLTFMLLLMFFLVHLWHDL
jgi:hypothetical protein